MESIIRLLSAEQLRALEIKRVRGEKTVNRSDECDMQIRLTHDGKKQECLDFRFFECPFIQQGALVSVLPTIEGLYLRCTNISDSSTRRLTFECKDSHSGALKIRITRASCEEFDQLCKYYAGCDYVLSPVTDEYFYAIAI